MAYKGKKKQKKKPVFFKWTAVVFLIAFILLALLFPGVDHEVSVLTDRHSQIDSDYQAAQAKLAGLKETLAHVSDTAVIERLARRYSECGWIGEIVYDVENLDSVREALYGTNEEKAEE